MFRTKIVGALAALGLLVAPAVAAAHGSGHHHGRHHAKHHVKKAHTREVTGTATATVASFTNGELTITTSTGKSFTATVTDRTILKCETAAPATATASRHGDDGDDDAKGDDAKGEDRGGRFDDGDDNDQGDDNGDGRCTTDALVAGAKVSEAKLSLKGGDATWKKVELLK